MNDVLELLSVSLQLHLVTLRFLLEIQVFLKQFIPPSLALTLPLGHLFYNPSVFYIFSRQVLQKLRENSLLLRSITSS